MTEDIVKDIIQRLGRLEEAVFDNNKTTQKINCKKFVGPTGGISLLISKGFFDERRGLSRARDELVKEGYQYSLQAVQMALSRTSKSGGTLVSLKENGKKTYVKRK